MRGLALRGYQVSGDVHCRDDVFELSAEAGVQEVVRGCDRVSRVVAKCEADGRNWCDDRVRDPTSKAASRRSDIGDDADQGPMYETCDGNGRLKVDLGPDASASCESREADIEWVVRVGLPEVSEVMTTDISRIGRDGERPELDDANQNSERNDGGQNSDDAGIGHEALWFDG